MKKIILLFKIIVMPICLLCFNTTARAYFDDYAQPCTIVGSGVVYGTVNECLYSGTGNICTLGKPLSNVYVNTSSGTGTSSSIDGAYVLLAPAGTFMINTAKANYIGIPQTISLCAGDNLEKNLLMNAIIPIPRTTISSTSTTTTKPGGTTSTTIRNTSTTTIKTCQEALIAPTVIWPPKAPSTVRKGFKFAWSKQSTNWDSNYIGIYGPLGGLLNSYNLAKSSVCTKNYCEFDAPLWATPFTGHWEVYISRSGGTCPGDISPVMSSTFKYVP